MIAESRALRPAADRAEGIRDYREARALVDGRFGENTRRGAVFDPGDGGALPVLRRGERQAETAGIAKM